MEETRLEKYKTYRASLLKDKTANSARVISDTKAVTATLPLGEVISKLDSENGIQETIKKQNKLTLFKLIFLICLCVLLILLIVLVVILLLGR